MTNSNSPDPDSGNCTGADVAPGSATTSGNSSPRASSDTVSSGDGNSPNTGSALATDEHLTAAGLHAVTGRPPLPTYFKQLWARRYYIHAEARSKAFTAGRNMILGNLWIILTPLLDAAIYGFIFGFLLHTRRGIEDFIPYLIIGVTFFTLLIKNLTAGIGLLNAKRRVIKAFSFPRAAIILSVVLKNIFDAIPVILVTLGMVIAFKSDHMPTLTWLIFPAIYLLHITFGAGLMFLSSYFTERIPDLSALVPIITRIWFYSSGIFFSLEHIIGDRQWLEVLLYNPAYILLTMLRDTLIYNILPAWQSWAMLAGWAFGTFAIGFLLFWSRESEYTRGKE